MGKPKEIVLALAAAWSEKKKMFSFLLVYVRISYEYDLKSYIYPHRYTIRYDHGLRYNGWPDEV